MYQCCSTLHCTPSHAPRCASSLNGSSGLGLSSAELRAITHLQPCRRRRKPHSAEALWRPSPASSHSLPWLQSHSQNSHLRKPLPFAVDTNQHISYRSGMIILHTSQHRKQNGSHPEAILWEVGYLQIGCIFCPQKAINYVDKHCFCLLYASEVRHEAAGMFVVSPMDGMFGLLKLFRFEQMLLK